MSPFASTARALRRDTAPDPHAEFAEAVLHGLSLPQKSLPCRFFYDERGSALFEQITQLPEYYPTRTERAILRDHAAEMAADIAPGAVLVELGSGSSLKTETLLDALPGLAAYVCIDVSPSALHDARNRLAARYPALDIRPIVGDFSYPIAFPTDIAKRPRIGFFPGSTIGNLTPPEARDLLAGLPSQLTPGGRLIVGVDLRKDADTLLRAYNDSAGVTAAFNLNLLERINRELGGKFDIAGFRHEAIYDPRQGRIEMHIVSRRAQEVVIRRRLFKFAAHESIHTENSYKYSIEQFQALAHSAGWRPRRLWTDADQMFSVHELDVLPVS